MKDGFKNRPARMKGRPPGAGFQHLGHIATGERKRVREDGTKTGSMAPPLRRARP